MIQSKSPRFEHSIKRERLRLAWTTGMDEEEEKSTAKRNNNEKVKKFGPHLVASKIYEELKKQKSN